MPASQAKITLRTGRPAACGDMPAALCGSFPTAGSPSVSVLDARRIKGAATSSDTAAEITTPSRTMSVLPLGAIASTERMLPGDAGATSPASVSEKNSSPAALPAIAATISTGRASM